MAFSFFKKHCPVCGMTVEKDKAVIRFDQYFCSEEHAEEYRQKMAKEKSQHPGGHSCCH